MAREAQHSRNSLLPPWRHKSDLRQRQPNPLTQQHRHPQNRRQARMYACAGGVGLGHVERNVRLRTFILLSACLRVKILTRSKTCTGRTTATTIQAKAGVLNFTRAWRIVRVSIRSIHDGNVKCSEEVPWRRRVQNLLTLDTVEQSNFRILILHDTPAARTGSSELHSKMVAMFISLALNCSDVENLEHCNNGAY